MIVTLYSNSRINNKIVLAWKFQSKINPKVVVYSIKII